MVDRNKIDEEISRDTSPKLNNKIPSNSYSDIFGSGELVDIRMISKCHLSNLLIAKLLASHFSASTPLCLFHVSNIIVTVVFANTQF